MVSSELKNALKGLDPSSVANYARHAGWDEVDINDSDRPVRILRSNEGNEVWIPADERVVDYETRMEESVGKISESVGKDIGDVIQEMSHPPSDIIRLGVSNEETKQGTIPLTDGISLYKNTRTLLGSAASSIEQPDVRYYREFSQVSERYTEECKIGRSEVGSYVAKIISPFEFFGEETDLFDNKRVSFSRQAAEKLMRSIQFLSDNLEEGDMESVLNPEDGDLKVSSNFCNSLFELSPDTIGTGLQFSLDNTKTAPPTSDQTPTSASLEQKHLPFIKKIAEELEPTEELVDSEFVGQVDSLRGRPNEKGQMQGLVRLDVLVEKFSGTLTASIRLGPKDYQRACDAHKTGETVRIDGILRLKQEEDRVHQFEGYDSFNVD